MIRWLFLFVFTVSSLTGWAQTMPTESMEMAKTEVIFEIEKLKMNSGSYQEGEKFIFIPALLPASTATAEFITMAFATGYISFQLRDELNGRLDEIKLVPTYLEAVAKIFNIFMEAHNAVLKTVSNVDKLRADGFIDEELDNLAEEISRKDKMCRRKENNNSPESFCPDYKRNFAREKFKLEKRSGGWVVTKGGKFQCCIEWDNVHCGFEIFNKKGVHQGEVGCLEDEFNPCESNIARGSHAKASPDDHKPRSKTCGK